MDPNRCVDEAESKERVLGRDGEGEKDLRGGWDAGMKGCTRKKGEKRREV